MVERLNAFVLVVNRRGRKEDKIEAVVVCEQAMFEWVLTRKAGDDWLWRHNFQCVPLDALSFCDTLILRLFRAQL